MRSTILPKGDHTPALFSLTEVGWKERIKRPGRRLIYPVLNRLASPGIARAYASDEFRPNLWLRGQRGSDYERQRRRVNRYFSLRGARLLIAGCGTGGDIASWLTMDPKEIVGVDWFNYQRAWDMWQARFSGEGYGERVRFAQGDLVGLSEMQDASFDVIGSDAVFEHLRDLPRVLREFRRVLRPGGVLYATFGPLWYSWGGDHVSGYESIKSGYNHLLLSQEDYRQYLNGLGSFGHSEHDGRTWIEHQLFSYLKPTEYLHCIEEAGFEREFVSAIVDPRGEECMRDSALRGKLLAAHREIDLLTCAMTIIYRRPR